MNNSARLAPIIPPDVRALPPTREALLQLLRAQPSPVSVSQLAEMTGWHGNTVRAHLQALWDDGRLTRTSESPGGRGRPSWLWSAKDRPSGTAYAALAGVLAEAVARLSPTPEREAHEAGRTWGLRLGADLPEAGTATELHERVVDTMREQGFSPELREARGGSIIALRQCPLIEAASARPEVVCAVHLGMVAGIVEALGGESDGSILAPFHAPGECELRLAVSPAARATASNANAARADNATSADADTGVDTDAEVEVDASTDTDTRVGADADTDTGTGAEAEAEAETSAR